MTRHLLLLHFVLIMLCGSIRAIAQYAPTAQTEIEFTTEQFEQWIKTVPGMTADLRDSMRGAHALYLERHNARFKEYTMALQGVSIDDAMRRYDGWRHERDALREQLFADFRSLLTDDMQPALAALDRSLRRQRMYELTMNNGLFAPDVAWDLIDRAERANLPDEDRERIAGLLDQFAAERDAVYRRVEPELRRLLLEKRIAGRNAWRNEAAMAKSEELWEKIRAFEPEVSDPIKRMDEQIMQILSPEGKIAWRTATYAPFDPGVLGESPVDRVTSALPGVFDELSEQVQQQVEEAIFRFEEQRHALRANIVRVTDEFHKAGGFAKLNEERSALLRQRVEEQNPTIDAGVPLLKNPRIPLVNDLLALELKTLRELDSLLPADVQKTMPVEARVFLRWGRHAPQR